MEYYIHTHARENGDHTLHTKDCPHLPPQKELAHIGDFSFTRGAVKEAEKHWKQVNGCVHCTPSYNHEDSE